MMTSSGVATITLSGPASGWFAVGLDAKLMHDNPYTLVVNDKGVTERKLGTEINLLRPSSCGYVYR